MIFLSLRVTADAEGGLKIRAHQRLDLQGIGGSSHQQARAGIYRGIACRYLVLVYPLPGIGLQYSLICLFYTLNIDLICSYSGIERIAPFLVVTR